MVRFDWCFQGFPASFLDVFTVFLHVPLFFDAFHFRHITLKNNLELVLNHFFSTCSSVFLGCFNGFPVCSLSFSMSSCIFIAASFGFQCTRIRLSKSFPPMSSALTVVEKNENM